MATVVIRGESVYKCSTCNRSIRVPSNPIGLDVISNCIITAKCEGKLQRQRSISDFLNTPSFPTEVIGLQNWSQRKVLYEHNQPTPSNKWTITHRMESVPKLMVYVYRTISNLPTLVEYGEFQTQIVDHNQINITFPVSESGLVQCISQSTQNTTNPITVESAATSSPIQVSTNDGTITLATLDNSPSLGVSLRYLTSDSTLPDVTIEYLGLDNTPSASSAWAGVDRVLIDNKVYTLRSLNITQTPLAPAAFSGGLIPDGSSFFVQQVNGFVPTKGQCLMLMSTSPHSGVDKTLDKFIDCSSISTTAPQLFIQKSRAYSLPSLIKQTYPSIIAL